MSFAPPASFVAIATFVVGGLVAARAGAEPLKVRVRGAARLTAQASRDATTLGAMELVLAGALTDDVGAPLPLRKVIVRVARDGAPNDEGARLEHARVCTGEGRAPTRGPVESGPGELVVTTDDTGRFCVRAPLDPARYRATLVYVPPPSSLLLDGAERALTFDLSRRALALRFDPAPRSVSVDAAHASIEAVALAEDDEAHAPRAARGLTLSLSNERETLAQAVTDASGHARFEVEGARLGPPGKGELRVRFDGDGATAETSHVAEIERHVKVTLEVPAAEHGELAPGVAENGIPVDVAVSSSAGPLDEGSVEARVSDLVVGTAPVERGHARLTLTFGGGGPDAVVRLRYVPASPWYVPGDAETAVRIPLRAPSLLAKAPLLATGIAVLALFLVGRGSGRRKRPLVSVVPPAPTPRAIVVRPAAPGERAWSGRVVDAHEGTPVASARVWIERGTFEGSSVLASAETDADGRFVLPGDIETASGERLVAEGRLHARLVQELPPAGELSIALGERRRALLARLVEWARRRGPPFDARPEATPGHVRRAAYDDPGTARWAEAVEEAAFGPAEVDARVEDAVERLGPRERRPDA